MRHTVPLSGQRPAVRAEVISSVKVNRFYLRLELWKTSEFRPIRPAELRLPRAGLATALMKPSRASEWPCPRGSSTWRNRNIPVS